MTSSDSTYEVIAVVNGTQKAAMTSILLKIVSSDVIEVDIR